MRYRKDKMSLVLEGKTTKDKLTILLHFIKFPYFYIFNIKHPVLIRDVTIQNRRGIFYCGNKRKDAFGLSENAEQYMYGHLNLDKGIFIDVGAYHGLHTIPIARQLRNKGKVIAVEPCRESLDILKKNIKLNNLNNVEVVEMACSSKEGEGIYNINPINHATNSLVYNFGDEKRKIKLTTIDQIVKDKKLKRVNLIKIDTEGEELNVLKGAIKTIKSFSPKIIIEIHNKNQKIVLDFLEKLSYKYKRLNKENYYCER